MLIKAVPAIPSREITDEQIYVRRREFLRLAGGAAFAAAPAPLLACASEPSAAEPQASGPFSKAQLPLAGYKEKAVSTDEKLNTFDEITSYNNFYEFGTGKGDPKRYSKSLNTSPWTVKIDGLCTKPGDNHTRALRKRVAR